MKDDSAAGMIPFRLKHSAPFSAAQAWRLALDDLKDAARRRELWLTMGMQDLRRRYRRSFLGPLWLTFTLALLVSALSLLYGRLMDMPLQRYVPHLAVGFIAWQFISGVVGDSCNVFIKHKGWITNVKTPLSLFVFKMIWEHLVMMAHNALVYVGVAVIFGIFAGAAGLLVVPGLAILIVNAVWVGLLFGTLCTRFRDISQVVQSLMRLAFFVTPVIWIPDQLGDRAYLALFNPFTYFLELIREPLLGRIPAAHTWGLALAVTVVGCATTALIFSRFRSRVPYWL